MEERLYYLLEHRPARAPKISSTKGLLRTGLTSARMGLLFFVAKHDGCFLNEVGKGSA